MNTARTPRPAATVMLIRDRPDGGVDVFLMHRHSRMQFAPGMMVFPGGGVDDRDRNSEIVWTGPEPDWWAERFTITPGLAGALVCTAVRETFEESGVLFAAPVNDPRSVVDDASVYARERHALAAGELSFADFLRAEKLVLRADLLRPWSNWVTPKAEPTRRYDTYFFVAALPAGQRADGENTESDHVVWTTPEAAIEDFAEGRTLLLPPTWSQLDSLAGRTVAEVLAEQREIVSVQPDSFVDADKSWVFKFFDADRYNEILHRRPSGGFS